MMAWTREEAMEVLRSGEDIGYLLRVELTGFPPGLVVGGGGGWPEQLKGWNSYLFILKEYE